MKKYMVMVTLITSVGLGNTAENNKRASARVVVRPIMQKKTARRLKKSQVFLRQLTTKAENKKNS